MDELEAITLLPISFFDHTLRVAQRFLQEKTEEIDVAERGTLPDIDSRHWRHLKKGMRQYSSLRFPLLKR